MRSRSSERAFITTPSLSFTKHCWTRKWTRHPQVDCSISREHLFSPSVAVRSISLARHHCWTFLLPHSISHVSSDPLLIISWPPAEVLTQKLISGDSWRMSAIGQTDRRADMSSRTVCPSVIGRLAVVEATGFFIWVTAESTLGRRHRTSVSSCRSVPDVLPLFALALNDCLSVRARHSSHTHTRTHTWPTVKP